MAKKQLKLKERACQIGSSINTRTEMHGEEQVPACDIPVLGVMLNQAEIDKLLGEGSHARLYKAGESGAIEPAFPDITEFKLSLKFKDCAATLTIDDETHTFADVKFKSLVLQLNVGGMTWLGFTMQTTDDIDVRAALNQRIRAQFSFGSKATKDDKQQSLALNEGEGGEADEDDDAGETKPKGRGNGKTQPAAH